MRGEKKKRPPLLGCVFFVSKKGSAAGWPRKDEDFFFSSIFFFFAQIGEIACLLPPVLPPREREREMEKKAQLFLSPLSPPPSKKCESLVMKIKTKMIIQCCRFAHFPIFHNMLYIYIFFLKKERSSIPSRKGNFNFLCGPNSPLDHLPFPPLLLQNWVWPNTKKKTPKPPPRFQG